MTHTDLVLLGQKADEIRAYLAVSLYMTSPAQSTTFTRRLPELPAMKVDLAIYLPRKPVQEFAKKTIIYSAQQPSHSLYLVVGGRVKLSTTVSGGEFACSIVNKGELFGEAALVDAQQRADSAAALDDVTTMSWSRSEIEQQVELNPPLGLALARHLARQCVDLAERMKIMVVHKTPERVMVAIVQLARAGIRLPDGSLRVESLTHQTLAEYVGTSREVVTFQLNRLRRLGLVRYTRKYTDVSVDGIEAAIRQSSPSQLPEKTGQLMAV